MADGKKGSPAKPTKPPKVKGAGKGRPTFELVGSADKDVYPFQAVPEGFDFDKFRPLKRKDFAADHAYLEYRALECEHKAKKYRLEAETAKKLGSGKDRNKAKRLIKMQERAAELRKQLEEQGVDVEALLAASAKPEE